MVAESEELGVAVIDPVLLSVSTVGLFSSDKVAERVWDDVAVTDRDISFVSEAPDGEAESLSDGDVVLVTSCVKE